MFNLTLIVSSTLGVILGRVQSYPGSDIVIISIKQEKQKVKVKLQFILGTSGLSSPNTA